MRIRKTDLAPDGVRMVIDWDAFVPGTSMFIPCLNYLVAVAQVREATGLVESDIKWRVQAEGGIYGVRVWRVR